MAYVRIKWQCEVSSIVLGKVSSQYVVMVLMLPTTEEDTGTSLGLAVLIKRLGTKSVIYLTVLKVSFFKQCFVF